MFFSSHLASAPFYHQSTHAHSLALFTTFHATLIEARSKSPASRGYRDSTRMESMSVSLPQTGGNKEKNSFLYIFYSFWLSPFTAGSKYRSASTHSCYTFTMHTSLWHCYPAQLAMTELTGVLVSKEHAAADWHIGWQSLLPLLSSIGQSVTERPALPLDDCWLRQHFDILRVLHDL